MVAFVSYFQTNLEAELNNFFSFKRCEACNSGIACKGIFGAINNAGPHNNDTKAHNGYNKSGPEIKISWKLHLEGEFKPASKIKKVKSPKVKAKRSINPTYRKQGPDSAIKLQSSDNQSTSFETFESEAKDIVETIPLDNISENNSIKREVLCSMLTNLRDSIRKQKPELDEIERRSDIISASVGIVTVEPPLEPKKEIERPNKYVI